MPTTAPTPGQLGAIPDDVLALHRTTAAPAGGRDYDLDGDEFASQQSNALYGSRSWRAVGSAGTAPLDSNVAVAATPDDLASSHKSRGVPNPRDNYVPGHGYVMAEDPAQPVDYSNALVVQDVTPKAPPERPRQGSTGTDLARPATYRRPMVMRAFDKWAADHAPAVDKIPMPSPTARTSWRLDDVHDAHPSAGGGTGTETAGVGLTPNTFRVLPRAWDQLLVNTGGPGVTAATPDPAQAAVVRQRSRSFRLG